MENIEFRIMDLFGGRTLELLNSSSMIIMFQLGVELPGTCRFDLFVSDLNHSSIGGRVHLKQLCATLPSDFQFRVEY
jgi:hypothetical protein